MADDPSEQHGDEPHTESVAGRLNWLRAGVLGANDGIISTAGLVVGVAAATTDVSAIATAGFAGLSAGAVSMAIGEYVSVSTQRDTEQALIEKEMAELRDTPEAERVELERLLRDRGLSAGTAAAAATEMTEHDALRAHLFLELGINGDELTNPWTAAWSSASAFTLGALVPLGGILLPAPGSRIPVAFVAVLLALAATGYISARLGDARPAPAVVRLLSGGILAMAVTFGVGSLLGVAVA